MSLRRRPKEKDPSPAELEDFLVRQRRENDRPARAPRIPARRITGVRVDIDGVGPASDRPCPVVTLTPRRVERELVVLHGGAYAFGPSPTTWRRLHRYAHLARARTTVPLYARVPNADAAASFPGVVDAYRRVAESAEGRLVLMGESAGGGYALGLLDVLRREHPEVRRPDRVVLVSPWLDLELSSPGVDELDAVDPALSIVFLRAMGRLWAGDEPADAPHLSPVRMDPTGLPPLTLLCGTREILLPENEAFRDAARAAGVDVEWVLGQDQLHVWTDQRTRAARAANATVLRAITGTGPTSG